jgi:hypothetical protein
MQPIAAPNNPAPPAAPAPMPPPIDQAAVKNNFCSWCNGEVGAGSSYCGTCKLKVAGGVIAGIFAAVVVLVTIVGTIFWLCFRGPR